MKTPSDSKEFLALLADALHAYKMAGKVNWGGGLSYGKDEVTFQVFVGGREFNLSSKDIKEGNS